jgi:gamma-glutamylaminecyclotransferase
MESVGRPGNFRVSIRVSPIHDRAPCTAFAYMKSRVLADPIHTEYLVSYQDRRFIPPEQRGSP